MKTLKPSGNRIILVRHGETEWNRLHRFQGRSDVPLNPKGRSQASALALALKNENISAIYASPLVRAMETAYHIARFHPAAPVIKESALVEMDLGDFEGMEAGQWAEKHVAFRKAWEKNPAALAMPEGESLEDVQRRAVDALHRLAKNCRPGAALLICSHNFVITSLLCYAANTPLDQFRGLRQDTAALSIIHQDGADFRVEKSNDCRHLQV